MCVSRRARAINPRVADARLAVRQERQDRVLYGGPDGVLVARPPGQSGFPVTYQTLIEIRVGAHDRQVAGRCRKGDLVRFGAEVDGQSKESLELCRCTEMVRHWLSA